ncbi:MAG: putative DNA-binding domain-containing protein [Bacteriovoracales bacterium]|nr:putative DNA-binding domain-containing protein [Bacteriovoracales bacterium]
MELKNYLSGWKKLLYEGQEADLGLSPKVSELYRGFVRDHYREILGKVYTRLDECHPCPWDEWAQGYFREYPPYAWELNHLARHFPDYLEKNRLVSEDLVDLARYEWGEYVVYSHRGSPKAWAERGRGGQGDPLYILNEAHVLLELRFDIAGWIFHWERENGFAPLRGRPSPKSNILVIARDEKTGNCVMTLCDIFHVALYEALSTGPSEGQNERTFHLAVQKILGERVRFTKSEFREKIAFLEKQSIFYRRTP